MATSTWTRRTEPEDLHLKPAPETPERYNEKAIIMTRKNLELAGTATAIIVPIELSVWLHVTPALTVLLAVMASVGTFWSNPIMRYFWLGERKSRPRWENVLAIHGIVFANALFAAAFIWACAYFFAQSFIEENSGDMPSVITVIVSLGFSWVFGLLVWISGKKPNIPLLRKALKASFWKGILSNKNKSQTK